MVKSYGVESFKKRVDPWGTRCKAGTQFVATVREHGTLSTT